MIETLNELAAVGSERLPLLLLQNTIFLALLLLALHLMKNASASARYAVAMVGLVKLLLPPFLPAPAGVAPSAVETLTGGGGIPFSFGRVPPVHEAGVTSPALWMPGGVVLAVWAVVAAGLILFSFYSALRLAVRLRGAEPVDDAAARDVESKIGIRVYRSDRIAMPLTLGVFPRRIYVPAAWKTWSLNCRTLVLRHELAHIRRRDGLVQVMQIVVQALWFFHPLVWLLGKKLNEYREMACDDACTVAVSRSPSEYSRNLVEIAESLVRGPVACEPASTLIRCKRELLRRVTYQLTRERIRTMSKRKTRIVLAGLAILMLPLSIYLGESAPRAEVVKSEKEIKLAKGGAEKKVVSLFVAGPGKYMIDGKKVDGKEIDKAFDYLGGIQDRMVVIEIECAEKVQMAAIYDLQVKLDQRKLHNVIYKKKDGEGLPLVLPPVKETQKKMADLPEKDVVHLMVTASGKVAVKGMKIPPEKTEMWVKKQLSSNEHAVVLIETEIATSYHVFAEVLERVKHAGATRIAVLPPKKAKA